MGFFNNEIDHYFVTLQLKGDSNFCISNFWMVENGRLGCNKQRIPRDSTTHSINIIYQHLNHDETLKHLKISLNIIQCHITCSFFHLVKISSKWVLGWFGLDISYSFFSEEKIPVFVIHMNQKTSFTISEWWFPVPVSTHLPK